MLPGAKWRAYHGKADGAKACLRDELDRCLPALLTPKPETQVRAIVKARELADKHGIKRIVQIEALITYLGSPVRGYLSRTASFWLWGPFLRWHTL
jgi:hypothetical protein